MGYAHERREAVPPVLAGRPEPRAAMPPLVPAPSLVAAYMDRRGLSCELAAWNGWYPTLLDGVPRLVIPAIATDPGWVFWQARALVEGPPRYDSPHVARKDALVILYPRVAPVRGSLLCEGPMDALAAAALGFYAVALMGATPPDAVWDHVARRVISPLTILADRDPDQQGIRAAARWITKLVARGVAIERVVLPPCPYKDLAEVPRERRMQVFA